VIPVKKTEAIITLEVGQVIDFDYDPEADFIIQED